MYAEKATSNVLTLMVPLIGLSGEAGAVPLLNDWVLAPTLGRHLALASRFQEGQQVGVDLFGMYGCHPVRVACIDLERAVPEQFG